MGRFVLSPTFLTSLASEMQQQRVVSSSALPEPQLSDVQYTYQPYGSQTWPPSTLARAIRERREQLAAQRNPGQYSVEQLRLQCDLVLPQKAYTAQEGQSQNTARVSQTPNLEPLSTHHTLAQEEPLIALSTPGYTNGHYYSLEHAAAGLNSVDGNARSDPELSWTSSRGTRPEKYERSVVELEIHIGPIMYVVREPSNKTEGALLDKFIASKEDCERENRAYGIEQKPQIVYLDWYSDRYQTGEESPLNTNSRPGTPRYQASLKDDSNHSSAAVVPQATGQRIKVALEMLRTIQDAVLALYGELEDMEAVSLEEHRCGSE
jgi:hypothetical protein